MHFSQVLLSCASLAAFAVADFHIVASNAANARGEIVEDTDIFIIGSNDDTHDKKCSNLTTGSFSVSTKVVLQFGENDACTNGLCLLQDDAFTFTTTNVCGVDGALTFQKSASNSTALFDVLDSHLNMLGHCFAASQQEESCIGDSNGQKFLAGDIDDLLFCQSDSDQSFCDPVV